MWGKKSDPRDEFDFSMERFEADDRDSEKWVAEITPSDDGGYSVAIVNTATCMRWGPDGLRWFTRRLKRARRIAKRKLAKKRTQCIREQIAHGRVNGKETIR